MTAYSPACPAASERLASLRAWLAEAGVDGFVVPHADEYQNEYLPPGAERLAWLTGFTGSAGQAVVTAGRAAIFVDGRYTLQVRAQVPSPPYEYRHLVEDPLERWVVGAMVRGERLAFDPRLVTPGWVERMGRALDRAGIVLVGCEVNPIDELWAGRPDEPLAPVVAHPLAFAGKPATEKCAELAEDLRRNGYAAAVLAAPESVAWLLNLRGGDVANTPLPLARAILRNDGRVTLFVDPRKPEPGLIETLAPWVTTVPPDRFAGALAELGRDGGRVLADPATTSAWIVERLRSGGAEIELDTDPCVLPRAVKNPVEIAGARAAHIRDGLAMCRFLRWLDAEAPGGAVSEIAAADRLEHFRREGVHYRGPSFDTIAGAGPNGAIVHYRALPETERRLEAGMLFLLDSGAQYLDGTTDVTRTLAIGTPADEARNHYTAVLKGHIALSMAVFPKGTTGSQIDALARAPLWAEGIDYDHGTGHGVGSYLSVHERPQRISKIPNTTALEPGMILSVEPGCYVAGSHGIRIENLVAVRPAAAASRERPMLEFETLTLVPYDRRLIACPRLTPDERAWIDAYHARVAATLVPLADSATAAWIVAATAPLG